MNKPRGNMNQNQVIWVGSILAWAGITAAFWLGCDATTRLRRFASLLLPVFVLLCGLALAQAPQGAGDYTTALPSVDKVKAELKGTDATDTIARQVAVFTYLQTYITRIRDARKYNGPF